MGIHGGVGVVEQRCWISSCQRSWGGKNPEKKNRSMPPSYLLSKWKQHFKNTKTGSGFGACTTFGEFVLVTFRRMLPRQDKGTEGAEDPCAGFRRFLAEVDKEALPVLRGASCWRVGSAMALSVPPRPPKPGAHPHESWRAYLRRVRNKFKKKSWKKRISRCAFGPVWAMELNKLAGVSCSVRLPEDIDCWPAKMMIRCRSVCWYMGLNPSNVDKPKYLRFINHHQQPSMRFIDA